MKFESFSLSKEEREPIKETKQEREGAEQERNRKSHKKISLRQSLFKKNRKNFRQRRPLRLDRRIEARIRFGRKKSLGGWQNRSEGCKNTGKY